MTLVGFPLAGLLLLVTLASLPVRADSSLPTSADTAPAQKAEIEKRLNSIILDKLNLDWPDPVFFAKYMTKHSQELDPEHRGVQVTCRFSGPVPVAPKSGAGPIHSSNPFHLEHVPLRDVLDYYCQSIDTYYKTSGSAWRIEGGGVVLLLKTSATPGR